MTEKVRVLYVDHDDSIPIPRYVDKDFFKLSDSVNINWRGEAWPENKACDIMMLRDGIHIIASPDGEERGLPLVKTVGPFKFYGILYIIKMHGFELLSISDEEMYKYAMMFTPNEISLKRAGLTD